MRLATVQKRNAFTLVELLVVIAIIVILMALTVGVISKVYVYLDEVKVVSEVNRMAQACEQFKSTFGRYPASRIILCENPNHYQTIISGGGGNGELAAKSSEYISSAFPNIFSTGFLIDWSGQVPALNNTANPGIVPISNNPGSRVFVLEGQECLVYFLGGIRPVGVAGTARAFTGFNTDRSRPCVVTTTSRLGPFFEFEVSRVKNSTNTANPASFFEAYTDVYGSAYAYFAAKTPGMNNYFHPGAPAMIGYSLANQAPLYDCFSLTGRFVPLWKQFQGAGISYHKGDSYQIISAGKDKLFGCGGLWNQADPETSVFDYMTNTPAFIPTDGTATIAEKQATYDNITNVTGGRVVPK